MSEALLTLSLTTSPDTTSATSSPGSVDGVTPCASPDGPMTDLFGRALVPVSPSAPQASSVAARMSATYGLRSAASSASAALQRSLASRLPALLNSRGSTMFSLTWRTIHTPLRRPLCQLAASAHRTSASACGGWPTPMAQDTADRTGNLAYIERRESLGYPLTLQMVVAAQLTTWPTPMAQNPMGGSCDYTRTVETFLGLRASPNARKAASGPPLSGSPAPTAKPGQLNPSFSRWLMGYPKVWDDCAPIKSKPSKRSA